MLLLNEYVDGEVASLDYVTEVLHDESRLCAEVREVFTALQVGNIEWNCRTCGWDPDAAPWYEALLVAGVPFLTVPLGIAIAGIRAAVLRTRCAVFEGVAALCGLALPWLYFLVG